MTKETGRPEDLEQTEPQEETIDKPVMDGDEEPPESDKDPRKGKHDPALIRHPEKDDETVAPYNI